MGELVAERVDQARVLEELPGPCVAESDPNLSVGITDTVASADVRTLCV
jgi:hypothetical protein